MVLGVCPSLNPWDPTIQVPLSAAPGKTEVVVAPREVPVASWILPLALGTFLTPIRKEEKFPRWKKWLNGKYLIDHRKF